LTPSDLALASGARLSDEPSKATDEHTLSVPAIEHSAMMRTPWPG